MYPLDLMMFNIFSIFSLFTTSVTQVESCGKCITPWLDFGQYCYAYFDTHLDFDAADAFCFGLSRRYREARLASISTPEENDFIQNLTRPNLENGTVWTGYKATTVDDAIVYGWVDASQSNFTAWAENSSFATEECALFKTNHASWVSEDCNEEKPFVCKIQQRNAVLGLPLSTVKYEPDPPPTTMTTTSKETTTIFNDKQTTFYTTKLTNATESNVLPDTTEYSSPELVTTLKRAETDQQTTSMEEETEATTTNIQSTNTEQHVTTSTTLTTDKTDQQTTYVGEEDEATTNNIQSTNSEQHLTTSTTLTTEKTDQQTTYIGEETEATATIQSTNTEQHIITSKILTTGQSTSTTTNPVTPFTCAGKASGHYLDPDDCHKYYQCAPVASVHHTCPGSNKFHPLCEYCVWEYQYDCDGGTEFCEGQADGRYPNPDSVTDYYDCLTCARGYSLTSRVSCPGILVFSSESSNCIWP